MCQVINWAFKLLLGAHRHNNPAPCSGSVGAAGSSAATHNADAKPLVALTGLLRVLWHCIHVEGVPVELRGVLLVAMALRNLLLVVALPLWARKAVAAQLRSWQDGLSIAQACNPMQHAGDAKLVHLLRVLKQVRFGRMDDVRQRAGIVVITALHVSSCGCWLAVKPAPMKGLVEDVSTSSLPTLLSSLYL
jgi:hypothetical protein